MAVNLPGISGVNATQLLKSDPKTAPKLYNFKWWR